MSSARGGAVVLRMVGRLTAVLVAVGAARCLPLGAQARIPCPAEQAAPTPANSGQVSDAIVCLSNQIRSHHGLPQLRRDRRLDDAAALHSLDMGTRNFFGHTSLDGLGPTVRAASLSSVRGRRRR